jgi:hypothetical protein
LCARERSRLLACRDRRVCQTISRHPLYPPSEEFGRIGEQVEDYSVYDFKTIWECSQEESNELVHAFFESTHFHEGVPVIPGALSSLQRMGDFCDLMVVTSRQHVIQQPTLDWLDDNFPEVFGEVSCLPVPTLLRTVDARVRQTLVAFPPLASRNCSCGHRLTPTRVAEPTTLQVHFGNHYALEGESRKKSEICAAIGAQVLIDDNPGYALDCAEAGMQVLLFDWHLNYPWAKTEGNGPSHPNITRVADWAAVETVLGVLARSEVPGVESAEPVRG